jgi:diguanylate cyclase (GGDEF)-like protein
MEPASRLLAAQLGIAGALAECLRLPEAAARILREICQSLDWQAGLLWIPSEDGERLELAQTWSESDAALEFARSSQGAALARGVGLPGRVWALGKPVWIPDVRHDPDFQRASLAETAGIRGGFGFPVRLGSSVLGVLEFFSRETREPDARVLEILEAIGRHVGQFAERRRAEDALLRQTAVLEELNARLETRNRQLEDAQRELRAASVKLVELATTDALTGVANHRAFQERLAQMVAEAERGMRLSLVVLDIDRFRSLNDSFGHPTGDEVLAGVARTLRESVRRTDFVARYGGEEFAVLLRDADLAAAAKIAEILRRNVGGYANPWRRVTASFGVAQWGRNLRKAEDLLRAADEALDRAKKSGRNCVRLARKPASRRLKAAKRAKSGGIAKRRRRQKSTAR